MGVHMGVRLMGVRLMHSDSFNISIIQDNG
jgi:hypothetical protein